MVGIKAEDMLYLDSLAGLLIRLNLVAGVTEDEEGYQYECREKHSHYHQALFLGHIVADLADRSLIFPFGPCHTLLYKG